jgi:hypothetical protein
MQVRSTVDLDHRPAQQVLIPSCRVSNTEDPWSLQDLRPDLAAEWDTELNRPWTPATVSYRSGYKMWWNCVKGHRWRARVASRTEGHGCPYCAGRRVDDRNSLAARHPEVAAQWDPEGNGDLTPDDVTYGSGRRVAWVCPQGHRWIAPVARRTSPKRSSGRGTGCPVCAGRTPGEKT